MPEIASYSPGTFCWVELETQDSAGAKCFYQELFGWSGEDNPIGPDQWYTILRLGGKEVGALFQMGSQERSAGVPSRWRSYVSVASADATAAQAAGLGGKVVAPPFDVMTAGRMAKLEDPTGAAINVWQPKAHAGAQLVNEPGAWCWNELATGDAGAAGDFYSGLFGWERAVQDMGPMRYTTFSNEGRPAAGMYQPGPDQGGMPAAWTVYFAVDDCDAGAARIQGLGGAILMPPSEAPGVGRFAVAADPQGAAFGIIKLGVPPV
jgi:predicted enzyme related to lactoylglutathione lyase